jgi:uncharacterized protein YkwD
MFTAGGLLLAGGRAAWAAPMAAPSWLDYEQRLTARADDGGGASFDLDLAEALLTETNRLRTSRGLEPVAWDEGLARSARAHLADMIDRRYFAHRSPEGFDHADRVGLLHRQFCGQTAENLAWRDYPAQATLPRHFETMWEQSPGHMANLVNPTFECVGYGVARFGRKVYAAGLYGDVAVRLAEALPMTLLANSEIATAMAGALPHIERLSITAPFERPTWATAPAETLPTIPSGLWQFRPLRASGSQFDVLPGPLFRIG